MRRPTLPKKSESPEIGFACEATACSASSADSPSCAWRHCAKLVTICEEMSSIIPRPYCATVPESERSVTMSTRVPPFSDASDET